MKPLKRLICRLRRCNKQRMIVLEKYEVLVWLHGVIVTESVHGKARCECCGRVRVGLFHKVLGVRITPANKEEEQS